MPLGDSITAGYTDNPAWAVPFRYGYRATLLQLLGQRAQNRFTFVGASGEPRNGAFGGDPDASGLASTYLSDIGQDKHRGYGGVGNAFLTNNTPAWMASDDPDVVLLMSGTNDITDGDSSAPASQTSALLGLVAAIYAAKPSVAIVVAQIIPKAADTPAIRAYNAFVRNTLVPTHKAAGRAIATVDQYAAILNGAAAPSAALFSNGSNHPQPDGYDRMAEEWFRGIAAVVPLRPRVAAAAPGFSSGEGTNGRG